MIVPCWSKRAISYLDKCLNKDMIVFEWGMGYSTLWLASRVKVVYSVEHTDEWFLKIKEMSDTMGLQNIQFFRFDLVDDRYYSIIEDMNKFDFIFVDGRNRVRCFEMGVNCLKKDGLIMLDDSERVRYSDVFNNKGLKIQYREMADVGDDCYQEATIFRKIE